VVDQLLRDAPLDLGGDVAEQLAGAASRHERVRRSGGDVDDAPVGLALSRKPRNAGLSIRFVRDASHGKQVLGPAILSGKPVAGRGVKPRSHTLRGQSS
jgi:hypothetical protein